MKSRSIFLSVILFTLFANVVNAQNSKLAFRSGEKCEYSLYYNWGVLWINAAQADLTVRNSRFDGNLTYELKMAVTTIKSFSRLNFKDTMVTQIDRKTLEPYFFRESSYEPDYYTKDRLTFFSNENTKWGVVVEQERKKGTKIDTITANKAYYDVLSTLYRLRNIDGSTLVLDQKMPMPMIFTDETYDLYVRYVGKEQVKLKNGKTYNCIKVKPLLAEGKMFEKGEGMTIWISDDKNHVPIMIESKLKVGSVKAMLNKIENTSYPMDSEVK